MKKNKALRIAAALLVVVAITTCGMTGALAKYVDDFPIASKTARAGLFYVTGPGSDHIVFDAQLLEADASTPEGHAKAYTGLAANDNIIVPGSVLKVNGAKIVNLSEVDVTVSLGSSLSISGFGKSGLLLFSKTGAKGSWSPTLPDATYLLGGTSKDLKSYPAKTEVSTGVWDNEATLASFYILWPFDMAGNCISEEESVQTDGEDTAIGTAQAEALLQGLGYVEATTAHDGECTKSAGDPVGEDGCTGLLDGCKAVPAKLGDYKDIQTDKIITIGMTVNAVQKD